MSEPIVDIPQRPNSENLKILLEPLEILTDFKYSDDAGVYTPPFATEAEACGFLSGSEGSVLCTSSDGEPIYSRNFVQCAGALVRNRELNRVFIIHQSLWSTAASVILALSKPDTIDVLTLHGPSGYMGFETVDYFHHHPAQEFQTAFSLIDRKNPFQYYPPNPQLDDLKHVFGDNSRIKGITSSEVQRLFNRSKQNHEEGKTNFLGEINIPVSREKANRWSLLYRPKEKVVWIYESGTHQLFKYAGFPELTSK